MGCLPNGEVYDINSGGGDVDVAIAVGNMIADTDWGIWVSTKSSCMSACVLILASGGVRSISGQIGIHRLFPKHSEALNLNDLDNELENITTKVQSYLRKHGASIDLANAMMTVPSDSIRILTKDEIKTFGLDEINAAQADLERIKLVRKCGWDFVQRKEAWSKAFGDKCAVSGQSWEEIKKCGMELRKSYGFPDPRCHEDSPMTIWE